MMSLVELILQILMNRPIIRLILSIIRGINSYHMGASPINARNLEEWEIVRSNDGQIQKIIIHRNLKIGYAEQESEDKVDKNEKEYIRVVEWY